MLFYVIVWINLGLTFAITDSSRVVVRVDERGKQRDEQDGGFPDLLLYKLRLQDRDVDMTLRRNHHGNEHASVFILSRSADGRKKIYKADVPPEEEVALYQDWDNGGTFTVGCRGDGTPSRRCVRIVRGSLYLDGKLYELSPDLQQGSLEARDIYDPDLDPHVYTLTPTDVRRGTREDETRAEGPRTPVDWRGKVYQLLEAADKMAGEEESKDTGTFGVELLVSVDYEEFSHAFMHANGWLPKEKEKNAVTEIRRYFSHIINGVDLRYRAIQDPFLKVYVRITAFLIATDPQDSQWTTTLVEPKEGYQYARHDVVDANNTLHKFRDMLKDMKGLPPFDHAMSFTGFDLKSGKNALTLGIAFVGAVCTVNAVSVVEARGNIAETIETATHELAHNLGANHDGEGNWCRTSDQYVMAAHVTARNQGNQLNPWKFSPCSIAAMSRHLSKLSSKGRNCLLNLALSSFPLEFAVYRQQPPGQRYDVAKQCQHILGPSSTWCSGIVPLSAVCTRLYCRLPDKPGRCSSYNAAMGTSCGHKMWCRQGQCRYDPEAPAMTQSSPSSPYRRLPRPIAWG